MSYEFLVQKEEEALGETPSAATRDGRAPHFKCDGTVHKNKFFSLKWLD
jgi:hypothetical protein